MTETTALKLLKSQFCGGKLSASLTLETPPHQAISKEVLQWVVATSMH